MNAECQTCPLMQAAIAAAIPSAAGQGLPTRCKCKTPRRGADASAPLFGGLDKPQTQPARPAPIFARFLADRCFRDPALRVGVSDLAAAAAEWYAYCLPGKKAPRSTDIGKQMKRYAPEVKVRRNRDLGRFYEGLGLKPQSK